MLSSLFPGFIYVIGGISDEGMELRSAEVYDPISRRWSALPVMVTRRAYVGVACLNNCIYAVGGWNEALGALETVEKYCPEEVMFLKSPFLCLTKYYSAYESVWVLIFPSSLCLSFCRRNGWRWPRCQLPVQGFQCQQSTGCCMLSEDGLPVETFPPQ